MPSLGADMESGVLVEWLKKPGDALHRGDVIAVVETDKGAIEIEVFEDGILDRIIATEGQAMAVGELMAVINGGTEPISPRAKPAAAPSAPIPEIGRAHV